MLICAFHLPNRGTKPVSGMLQIQNSYTLFQWSCKQTKTVDGIQMCEPSSSNSQLLKVIGETLGGSHAVL